MTRDPRTDPRAGDCLRKKARSGRLLSRTIVRREGGNIWWASKNERMPNNCWITTWQSWSRDAEIVRQA